MVLVDQAVTSAQAEAVLVTRVSYRVTVRDSSDMRPVFVLLIWAVGCGQPGPEDVSERSAGLASTSATASVSASAPPRAVVASASAPVPTVDSATLPDVVGDPRRGWPEAFVPSRVRDRVELDFAGAKETWLLRWKEEPKPACFVEEAKQSGKCLGIDGAGESGQLEIVRIKDGKEIASEDLTELLAEKGPLVLPRYADGVRFSARGLTTAPPKPLLVLGDYNQDGVAAEFVMQGPMRVWAPRPGVLIGFGKGSGKLFGYKTIDTATWEKVKTTSSVLEVVTTRCFDHASPTEYVDIFTKTSAGVTRGRKEFTCIDKGSSVARGAVVSSEPDEPLGP